MEKGNYSKELINYLSNQMTDWERKAFEEKVFAQVGGKEELENEKHIWLLLGEFKTPPPSKNVSTNFYKMLEGFKGKEGKSANIWTLISTQFELFWSFQPKFKLAYSLVLLVAGLGVGMLINNLMFGKKDEIGALSKEVKEVKEMMMLSLLENPSASERIRAVSFTEELPHVDKKVIDALLVTLNNDTNDNVRIMTLEALAKMADEPMVREGLVESITKQDSPLVQSAMADVMVKLQEKRSIKHFNKLLKRSDLNSGVKTKIQNSVQQII